MSRPMLIPLNLKLQLFYVFVLILYLKFISNTIDINGAELQYLADHLTLEECRKLVAAAHFKTYEVPNALDQAGNVIFGNIW